MKKLTLLFVFCIFALTGFAQSYNQEQMALKNFLVRMYKSQPFEGVKVVSDYENNYLLSGVLIKKSASESAMNRVAQVKSARQVSQYLNGITTISSKTIIRTSEDVKNKQTIEEITDIIKEHSIGFTKSMEALASFDKNETERVYMFFRIIEEMKE